MEPSEERHQQDRAAESLALPGLEGVHIQPVEEEDNRPVVVDIRAAEAEGIHPEAEGIHPEVGDNHPEVGDNHLDPYQAGPRILHSLYFLQKSKTHSINIIQIFNSLTSKLVGCILFAS